MTQKPAQRRGLGRGLGSLIPTAPVRTEETGGNGHGDSAGPGQESEADPDDTDPPVRPGDRVVAAWQSAASRIVALP